MPTDAENERTIQRDLAGMSPRNQQTARDFIRQKRNETCKPATLKNYAKILARLDTFANGRPFMELAAGDLAAFLEARGQRLGPASMHQISVLLKHFFRWLLAVETLPRELSRTLRVAQPRRLKAVKPVDAQEFHQLLDYANDARSQAILWTLWDSGLRVGELVSLNIDSVDFDDKGGARLRLPLDAEGLKTGPRTVYVVDCVGPLRAWLALHPKSGDPKAPLFASTDSKAFGQRPVPHALNRSLFWWCRGAAIRPLYPHLFRHARATRAARAGWVEAEMRAYFGWTATSKMPSIYIHLAAADMEARVRQDAGIDTLGVRQSSPALEEAALESRLKSALRRLLTEPDAPLDSRRGRL